MSWLISPYWLKHEYFIWPDTCSILCPPKWANAHVHQRESAQESKEWKIKHPYILNDSYPISSTAQQKAMCFVQIGTDLNSCMGQFDSKGRLRRNHHLMGLCLFHRKHDQVHRQSGQPAFPHTNDHTWPGERRQSVASGEEPWAWRPEGGRPWQQDGLRDLLD